MKLYYAPGACSQASHIALVESGLPFELARVAFGAVHQAEDGKPLGEVSAKNAVPVLRLDDGRTLTENAVILQYIADAAGAGALIPPAGSWERYRVLEWLNFIATELHRSFSPLFRPNTPEEYKPVSRALVDHWLDYVENAIGPDLYLTGAEFTVADAYLFVILGWAGALGFDMDGRPKLSALAARIAQRESVQHVLKAEGFA